MAWAGKSVCLFASQSVARSVFVRLSVRVSIFPSGFALASLCGGARANPF